MVGGFGSLDWWWFRLDCSGVAFLRRVRTASGATAVQIVEKQGRVNQVVKHLGSALDEASLKVLLEKGRRQLCPDQLEFDLFGTGCPGASLSLIHI